MPISEKKKAFLFFMDILSQIINAEKKFLKIVISRLKVIIIIFSIFMKETIKRILKTSKKKKKQFNTK